MNFDQTSRIRSIAYAHVEIAGFAEVPVYCKCGGPIAAIALISVHRYPGLRALWEAHDVRFGFLAIHFKR